VIVQLASGVREFGAKVTSTMTAPPIGTVGVAFEKPRRPPQPALWTSVTIALAPSSLEIVMVWPALVVFIATSPKSSDVGFTARSAAADRTPNTTAPSRNRTAKREPRM
jgi:hypothetical protein